MSSKPKPLVVDADQIGMLTWIIGVLIIGLKLVLTANRQPGFVHVVELASFASYAIGLILIVVSVLHVLWTYIKANSAPQQARRHYAKPAALPLWYHAHDVASERRDARPRRITPLRFDHGRAGIWGVEYLIAATIIQAALQLTAEQPIWPQIGWLVVCVALRTLLLAVHDQVSAHGHTAG